MAKNLVIVESPAKAKTIEGFLGDDFIVKSSFGHIRDLPQNDNAIDIENNFLPKYEISEDKKKTVEDLKKFAKKAEMVWLATDEDREGEAISWHLSEALGLTAKNTKRIVFHEITKQAILNAIKNPRQIDMNLVDAQQARRVLDRLVGFELSPILWRKIKPSLSAGRVQSVAVRLIVEREREISSFKISSSYKIVAVFSVEQNNGQVVTFKAELPTQFSTKAEAKSFLEKQIGADFIVKNVEKKPLRKSPSPPFTTSTLQQEASRKLGFSVAQTMLIAQHLYESGKITYMRTDSVNLSETAIHAAKNEIEKTFGKEYSQTRHYKTKSKGAQEAHEAIRPTYMENRSIDRDDARENRLYDLIWKRTIASQMSDAEIEKTIATISSSKTKDELIATGEVIKFDGFLKAYMESSDDEDDELKEGMLPVLSAGQKLQLDEMNGIERFTQPAARYTEASLVKKLEGLGIGRPSTYAPTISTIQKRGYVVKENRDGKEREYQILTLKNLAIVNKTKKENFGTEKGKLFPTDIGSVVNDFLVQNFEDVLDYNFTAKVEEEFDEIAEGQKVWNKMIKDFYKPFHKDVEATLKTSERATGERLLGKDTKSGKNVYVRIGRFGPIVQMGESETKEDAKAKDDSKEKPKFASLRKDQRIEALTLEEALELFKLPRNLGAYEKEEIIVAIGRFGPYIKYKDVYYSLPKEDDPYSITLERAIEILKSPKLPRTLGKYEDEEVMIGKGRFGPYAKHKNVFYSLPKGENPLTVELARVIEIIKDKQSADSKKIIKTFEKNPEVKVLNGRFGPYISIGKQNVKIPKNKEPQSLTLEECLKLAETEKPKTSKPKTRKAAMVKE